jgi:hypothetical protein
LCTQLGHLLLLQAIAQSTLSAAVTVHLQGGKPSKRQAAAPREAPEHQAMPTRFYTNVMLLLFWQAQLMAALTQLK